MFYSEPLVEACEEGAFSEGLRALFARFYCDLLQGFEKHFHSGLPAMYNRGDQTKVGSSLFNIESFMASQDSSGSRVSIMLASYACADTLDSPGGILAAF